MTAPAVTFGASAHFGVITGWNYVGPGKIEVSHGLAEAKDAGGNTTAAAQLDEKITYSSALDCSNATNTVPPDIGALLDSKVLESIGIELDYKACAKMTLSGHNHTANAHATVLKAAHGIAVTQQFGAVDMLGGTAGANACVKHVSIQITCGHNDEPDASGDAHFAGANSGGKVVITQTWLGVPTTAYDAATWPYATISPATTDESTGATCTIVSVTKYLVLA